MQRICVLLSHNTYLYKHPHNPQYSDMWDKKTQSDDWRCSMLGFGIGNVLYIFVHVYNMMLRFPMSLNDILQKVLLMDTTV